MVNPADWNCCYAPFVFHCLGTWLISTSDLSPLLFYQIPGYRCLNHSESCRASSITGQMRELTVVSDFDKMRQADCGWWSEGVAGQEEKLVEGGGLWKTRSGRSGV